MIVTVALLVVACGGPQSGEDTGDGTRPSGTVQTEPAEPAGPTEEELRQQRELEARQAFQRASELWSGVSPSERDYAAIERSLERAVELDPDLVEARFNLGVVKQEQGALDEALTHYRAVLDHDANFTQALANIGLIQLSRDELDAATETFEECIARSQIEPGCNINLSVIYRMQALEDAGDGGEIDPELAQQAIDRLRFALGGDGRNADAYANLARVYYDMGRIVLARLVCENAIQLGIDAAVLHNRLGLIALEENNVIEAYSEFRRAVELDPTLLQAHLNIGAMALSFRDYQTARASFERVLEDDPDNLDAKLSLGVALRGLDEYDAAKELYEQVLTERPGDLGAIFNLGVLYQEFYQDYDEAIGYFERYVEAAHDAPGQATRLEEANQRIGVLRELIELLQQTEGETG